MPTLSIDNDELVLRMHGWERLFAAKSELRAPLARIAGATLDDDITRDPRGIKMPGSRIPGKLYAGTWLQPNGKSFWFVRPPHIPLVIELNDDAYQRWVLNLDDAAAWVRCLNRAASRNDWFGGVPDDA